MKSLRFVFCANDLGVWVISYIRNLWRNTLWSEHDPWCDSRPLRHDWFIMKVIINPRSDFGRGLRKTMYFRRLTRRVNFSVKSDIRDFSNKIKKKERGVRNISQTMYHDGRRFKTTINK